MGKVQDNIDKYGWHIISVLADDCGPGFSYSIGLDESFGHPELIFVGLKTELSQILINNIGHSVKGGTVYENDLFYSDILDGFQCQMLRVDYQYYDDYVGQAKNYYNSPFPLLQCIYPTVNGVYPWEEECPESLRLNQPLLK